MTTKPEILTPQETDDEESEGPFDPNGVRTRLWMPSVAHVLSCIDDGSIDLSAQWRQRPNIWTDAAQSRLIESILVRLPLPSFYMVENDDGILAVIDGLGRLLALKRFVTDDDLPLTGLEFLIEGTGRRFSELPRSLQRRIYETSLTVHLIEKGTPAGARATIFMRINTGGPNLTAQQVRAIMNPGPAQAFLDDLAESEEFKRATGDSVRREGMRDHELVLRFLAFLIIPPEDYQARGFNEFLNRTMRVLNKSAPLEREGYAYRFRRAMTSAADIFGEHAFRNPTSTGQQAPINKATFDAWAIGLDRCTDAELKKLVRRKERLIDAFIGRLSGDEEFEKALLKGSGHKNKVRIRHTVIHELIREALRD